MALTDPGKKDVVSAGSWPWTPSMAEGIQARREADGVAKDFVLVAAESGIKRGMLIGYASGWKMALATVGTAIDACFVALEDASNGQSFKVAPWAVLDGFTGGTPGNPLYLEEGTGFGKVTDVRPSTTGDLKKQVGYMITATRAFVAPAGIEKLVA